MDTALFDSLLELFDNKCLISAAFKENRMDEAVGMIVKEIISDSRINALMD